LRWSHEHNSNLEQYILLTADVAADDTDGLRLGSLPTWLNTSQGDEGVRVIHHSDVFRVPESSLPPNTTTDVESRGREWRDRVVPSFNSLAIESQLAHIQDLAPTMFCALSL
jgi:hypothetical protein